MNIVGKVSIGFAIAIGFAPVLEFHTGILGLNAPIGAARRNALKPDFQEFLGEL